MDTFEDLCAGYRATLIAIADLGAQATPEQWAAPTACPGWTVGDMVAHAIDIEQIFMGEDRVKHEPDFAALPWADSDLSRIIELGVDARRGRPQHEVTEELRALTLRRLAQLESGPHDLSAEVPGWMGKPGPLGRQLRLRTMDLWVHLVDMSDAMGVPVDWYSPAAHVSASLMLAGQERNWSTKVTAGEGTGVRLVITDIDQSIELGDSPTTTISLDWPSFMHRATGRIASDDAGWRAGVVVTGDELLATAVIDAMVVTP